MTHIASCKKKSLEKKNTCQGYFAEIKSHTQLISTCMQLWGTGKYRDVSLWDSTCTQHVHNMYNKIWVKVNLIPYTSNPIHTIRSFIRWVQRDTNIRIHFNCIILKMKYQLHVSEITCSYTQIREVRRFISARISVCLKMYFNVWRSSIVLNQ